MFINQLLKLCSRHKCHAHKWTPETGNDFRVIVLKIHHCECGAIKLLTHYGWRVLDKGRLRPIG